MKLARVLRAYKGWLQALGAAIVLAIFLVNDVKRDNAKELSDKIAMAVAILTIREDVSDFKFSTESSLQEIEHHSKPVAETKRGRLTPDDRAIHQAYSETKSAAALAPKLDYYDQLFAVLQHHTALDNVRLALHRVLDCELDYRDSAARLGLSSGLDEKLTSQYRSMLFMRQRDWTQAMENLAGKLSEAFNKPKNVHLRVRLDQGLELYARLLRKESDAELERAEREKQVWRTAGLVLYPLGIVVGVIGKLYDVDIAVGE